MQLKELIKKLEALEQKGYLETSRQGPTGIGHLLEKEMGLFENNIPIPDIGGRVELKATRRNVNSLITLFTFNQKNSPMLASGYEIRGFGLSNKTILSKNMDTKMIEVDKHYITLLIKKHRIPRDFTSFQILKGT